jgi:RNA polymerase sigma-70 factor (ECF subfamily)
VEALKSDSELVLLARGGDRDAFGLLVIRYERLVIAASLMVLGNREDARDVAQDVFVMAYRKMKGLWIPRRFGPWVLRIARNAALRHRKRRQRWQHQELPEDLSARPSRAGHEAEPMLEFIARLPDREAIMVMLRYFDDLTIEEISRVTDRPIGTVTKQLSRARQQLRTWIHTEDKSCGRATTSI